mmetsp:Transcript_22202/g.35851  ORF Transcript_22202/g.35851 Transcript_22202/m.35851 type:complete len:347 (-) Transcript_22202:269-1309(-)
MSTSLVRKVEALQFPFQTPDPFLFAVYHNDAYPAGDDKMQAPRKGDGADFDPSAPYRMYHGDRVPGFPQHPHRGFETITATMDGIIDHTDSVGNAGRYGLGDLQWMTAGKGIVHGEMFPLVNNDRPNHLRLFQIWLNLPSARKMTEPAFVMHWAPDIARVRSADGLTSVVVWAGELMGARGAPPPPMSWAADSSNDVAVWFLTMKPGASFTLPPAAAGSASNRTLYFFAGAGVSVGGRALTNHSAVELDAAQSADLHVPPAAGNDTLLLILQGKPIGEPVAQHGPFVMNTRAEINQAFSDYQETQFGGWPWPDDAMVFPRDKGRFALVNGKETRPPDGGSRRHDEM